MKEKVYVLMEDLDGTTFSKPESLGVALRSESDANKFCVSPSYGRRKYCEVVVYDSLQDAKNEKMI